MDTSDAISMLASAFVVTARARTMGENTSIPTDHTPRPIGLGSRNHALRRISYRAVGAMRQAGVPFDSVRIVFAIPVLAFQWYASEGTRFLDRYGCVFFDEVADAERSPEYAILWEVATRVSQTRSYTLKLAAASATMSARMKNVFNLLAARWIVCHSRPFAVERYVIKAIRASNAWH